MVQVLRGQQLQPTTQTSKNMFSKIGKYALWGCAFMIVWTLAACSEDENNPKYQSLPPEFSGVTLTGMDGDETLKVNTPILVTAQQSQKGKLIYKAQYTWSCVPDSASHHYTASVVYDLQNQHPTDTIVVHKAGTYTIRMHAQYHISGSYALIHKTIEWDQGKAVYTTPSPLFYIVDVEQKFNVK